MPPLCRERATADEARRGQARGGAQAPPGKPLHLGSRASCLLRGGDAIDPTALLRRRGDGQPELLLQSSGEEPPDRVPLPTHYACDLVTTVAPSDRCRASQSRHPAL